MRQVLWKFFILLVCNLEKHSTKFVFWEENFEMLAFQAPVIPKVPRARQMQLTWTPPSRHGPLTYPTAGSILVFHNFHRVPWFSQLSNCTFPAVNSGVMSYHRRYKKKQKHDWIYVYSLECMLSLKANFLITFGRHSWINTAFIAWWSFLFQFKNIDKNGNAFCPHLFLWKI